MESGDGIVAYGQNLVQGLPAGSRDFLSAHELAHTLPENQDMLGLHPRRAEYLADEFAARQPGARLEDARRLLTSPDMVREESDSHPSVEDRLQNIDRVIRERNTPKSQQRELGDASSAMPETMATDEAATKFNASSPKGRTSGAFSEDMMAQLDKIAFSLSGHGQKGIEFNEGSLVSALSVPAPERSLDREGRLA